MESTQQCAGVPPVRRTGRGKGTSSLQFLHTALSTDADSFSMYSRDQLCKALLRLRYSAGAFVCRGQAVAGCLHPPINRRFREGSEGHSVQRSKIITSSRQNRSKSASGSYENRFDENLLNQRECKIHRIILMKRICRFLNSKPYRPIYLSLCVRLTISRFL
jgi:hypothetical protein